MFRLHKEDLHLEKKLTILLRDHTLVLKTLHVFSQRPPSPTPAHSTNPARDSGKIPPTHVFPDKSLANSVYITDAHPPHPCVNGNNEYSIGGAGAEWIVPEIAATQQMEHRHLKHR